MMKGMCNKRINGMELRNKTEYGPDTKNIV